MPRSAEQIVADIEKNWSDSVIAHWVLEQLALFKYYSKENFPVPVHTISITGGRYLFSGAEIKDKTKFVISGGLEGTRGHVLALEYLHEARVLMPPEDALITVLLEPDSYIQGKGREPLNFQEERAELWRRSSLVDLVVCLPDRAQDMALNYHYQRIGQALGGRVHSFTTDQHPFFLDILSRGFGNVVNLPQLIPQQPTVHASFLASTRTMTPAEFYLAYSAYSAQLLALSSLKSKQGV